MLDTKTIAKHKINMEGSQQGSQGENLGQNWR